MAGDRWSAVPLDPASRANYTIGVPDASIPSGRDSGTAVRDALQLCHDLLSQSGEAPGTHFAARILAVYASFDEAARAAFFDGLVDRFSVDPSALQRAAESYLHN